MSHAFLTANDYFLQSKCDGETLLEGPGWIDLNDSSFDLNTYALQFDEGCILFSKIDDMLGKRIISLPYSDLTKPNIASDRIVLALSQLREAFPDYILSLRLLGTKPPGLSQDWEITSPTCVHHVPICTESEMMKAMSSSFRRAIRKAERNGIRVMRKTDEQAFWRFHELYVSHRRSKFKLLPQPHKYFEKIYSNFFKKGCGWVFEGLMEDEVLSSIVVLKHQNVLYYRFGASGKNGLDFRPNNLIFMKLFEFAIETGIDYVDLGASPSESEKDLIRFKSGMGGIIQPITFLKYIPPNYNVRQTQEGYDVLSSLTSLLVNNNIEDIVLEDASEILSKYFNQ